MGKRTLSFDTGGRRFSGDQNQEGGRKDGAFSSGRVPSLPYVISAVMTPAYRQGAERGGRERRREQWNSTVFSSCIVRNQYDVGPCTIDKYVQYLVYIYVVDSRYISTILLPIGPQ